MWEVAVAKTYGGVASFSCKDCKKMENLSLGQQTVPSEMFFIRGDGLEKEVFTRIEYIPSGKLKQPLWKCTLFGIRRMWFLEKEKEFCIALFVSKAIKWYNKERIGGNAKGGK